MSIAVAATRADEEKAFFAGQCDLLTGDASEIYSAARAQGGGAYIILSDRLSKEPLAPVVRAGDDRLLDVVRWSIFAPIEAEELGVTKANVDTYANSGTFGSLVDGAGSAKIGLGPDWPRAVIRAIGNYGEVYERNLGASGNVALPRGLNDLWTRGGLLYSPPLR
jgi:general L-amino acid transport system substrate-binding protein